MIRDWYCVETTRRFVIVAFTLVVLLICVLTWKSEHDSCVRTDVVNVFMRDILEQSDPEGKLPRPHNLECNKLIPDNGTEGD
jgi:hypothetical protein